MICDNLNSLYPLQNPQDEQKNNKALIEIQAKSLTKLIRLEAVSSGKVTFKPIDENLPDIIKDEIKKKNESIIEKYRSEGAQEALSLLNYTKKEEEKLEETIKILKNQIKEVKKNLKEIRDAKLHSQVAADYIPLAKLFTEPKAYTEAIISRTLFITDEE